MSRARTSRTFASKCATHYTYSIYAHVFYTTVRLYYISQMRVPHATLMLANVGGNKPRLYSTPLITRARTRARERRFCTGFYLMSASVARTDKPTRHAVGASDEHHHTPHHITHHTQVTSEIFRHLLRVDDDDDDHHHTHTHAQKTLNDDDNGGSTATTTRRRTTISLRQMIITFVRRRHILRDANN